MKSKKIVALLLSVLMVLSAFNLNVFALGYGAEWGGYNDAVTTRYSDVPQTFWAYDAIMRCSDKNWFSGYPDGRFMPNGSITRGEAVKVFVEFIGLKVTPVTETSFYDVDPGKWYAPYIEAGKDLFPVHTTVQGRTPFNPEMPVTREDTIYALVNALGYQIGEDYVDESVLNMFSDKNSISGNLRAHFAIALKNGLVSGYPDGTIRAQDSLSRAEFASLLYRGTFLGHSGRYEAKIENVTVAPASPVEITIGETVTLSARATYTDGSNQPYTSLQPYYVENNGVIVLNGTSITGLKEGTATIKYNDSYLKNDSLTVIVKKPSDAPKIKITEYPEVTELNKVTIGGFVEDSNIKAVDLVCNDKDVRVGQNGEFTTEVSLNVGTNEFKFVAVNQYGVTAEKTITIQRTDVPSLQITNYKERTTAKTTPVSGVIEYYDLNSITLSCNGEEIPFNQDGTFTITVNLKVGKNPFHFEAITAGGNTAEQAIVIRRYEEIEEEEEEPVVEPTKKPEKEVYSWDWMDTIPTTTQYKSVEAVLVIDDSGSLGGDYGYNSSSGTFSGGNDPYHKRLEVARKFVDSANEKSKIGIIKFDSSVKKVTSNLIDCDADGKNTLKDMLKINNGIFDSKGYTYMYSGIQQGFELFESTDPEVMKVMIVFSDGIAHDTEKHAQTVLSASDKNITIYSVGLGASNSSYFESYMKPLATSTGGSFYLADNADDLKDIFEVITTMIDTKTDSDGDGIEDYYEDTMLNIDGSPMALNKNSADTDGDGLKDGEEIRLDKQYNNDQTKVKVTAYMTSDPTVGDTDGDGVSDRDDSYPLDPDN